MSFPYKQALDIAEELRDKLAPACERIIIAGSLRRLKSEVGDIELLAIPTYYMLVDRLDQAIKELIANGILDYRLNTRGSRVYGPKNKLLIHKATGIPVDIFSTTSENWWVALVVRTGSKESNIAIAKAAHKYNLHLLAYGAGFQKTDGSVIVCHSEQEVFETVGLDYLQPWERNG